MEIIRHANPKDASSIRAIYAPYVEETPTTFEIEIPTVDEMRSRIEEYSKKFPYLVTELNGEIIAYAYAAPFKARAAYRWSVESSIYVHRDHAGKGVGKRLFSELIEKLKTMGVLNIIGGITLPNQGSVALHEKMGFRFVGKFPVVGFKQGQWWDVGYWQLTLPKPEAPEELRKNNY